MAHERSIGKQMTRLLFLVLCASSALGQITKVWAVDGSESVYRDRRDSPARDNDSNKTFTTAGAMDSIHQFGGRNDCASFQLVLECGATSVDSLNVILPFLTDGTNVIQSTSASCSSYTGRDIESFLVNFVYTDSIPMSNTFWHNAFPGVSADYLGWAPDQLVPMEAPRKQIAVGSEYMQGGSADGGFKLYANRNAVVWFDVFIGKSKPAGIYRGRVKVYKVNTGDTLYNIPVDIRVFSYTLSDTNFIPTMTHIHHVSTAERAGVVLNSDYYWNTFIKRWQFFTHKHRMDLVLTNEHIDTLKARRMGYYSGWRYTPAQGYEGPGQSTGQRLYVAALWNVNFNQYPSPGYQPGQAGPFGDTQTGWRDLSDAFVQAFMDSAPPTIVSAELLDEPNSDEQLWSINVRADWIRTGSGVGKNIQLMIPNEWLEDTTVFHQPATGFSTAISMWAQNPHAGPTYGNGYHTNRSAGGGPTYPYHTVEWLRARMASDNVKGLVGTYNSSPGYTPETNSIGLPAVQSRLWGYIWYDYNVDWYWAWTSTQWAYGDANPWRYIYPYGQHNTDGNLMYWGRDISYPNDDRGVNVPIASVRLKNHRDAIRDYSMLYEANRRGVLDTAWINMTGVYSAFDDWRYSGHQKDSPNLWTAKGYVVEDVRWKMALALDAGGGTPPAGASAPRLLFRRKHD